MHLQPSRRVLKELERIGDRRAEIEAATVDGDGEAEIRRLLLATLDEMEEEVCAHGCRSPAVREGWDRLARFGSFGRNGDR